MAAPAEIRAPVRFDPVQKCFFRGDRKLMGLLQLAAQRFYPEYDFTKATFNRAPRDQTEYKERKEKKAEVTSNKRLKGFNTGIQLDKQLTQTVEILRNHPDLDFAVFYNKAVRDQCNLLEPDERVICDNLLRQTKKFWSHCQRVKLFPYETQRVLQFPNLDVAHALDVICIDSNGRDWIIEVKSGYDGYLQACTKHHMRAPLDRLTDSKVNQFQIQLAIQVELWRLNNPGTPLGGYFVLHIPEEGDHCNVYRVGAFLEAITDWQSLLAEVTDKKRHLEDTTVAQVAQVATKRAKSC